MSPESQSPGAPGTQETLVFDDLRPFLLLKNGNYLYKLPFRDGHAVLKVYIGSRGTLGRIYKSFANVVLYGQTSYLARTRKRIEHECLALWAEHGFRTFGVYEDVDVKAPQAPAGYWLLLEYLDRIKIDAYVSDEKRDLDDRLQIWHKFLGEFGKRHKLAIELREPRLVHENGDGKHVMILDDGELLWFDFEMVYRSKSGVAQHVAHEIIQFLWQILKKCEPQTAERLLNEAVAHYPDRERLEDAWRYFLKSPNIVMRAARAIDMRRKRARKPTSKYNVARRLKEALERA